MSSSLPGDGPGGPDATGTARDRPTVEPGTRPLPATAQDSRLEGFEHRVLKARTSAAATFALVFGVVALLCALSVILSLVGAVLAVVGLVLGFVGFRATRRAGITGRTLAVGGVVLSLVALVLATIIVAGVTTVLNNQDAVTWLENRVEQLRNELPQDVRLPDEVTPN